MRCSISEAEVETQRARERDFFAPHKHTRTLAQLWRSLSCNGIKSALTPQWRPGHNVTIQLIFNARSAR